MVIASSRTLAAIQSRLEPVQGIAGPLLCAALMAVTAWAVLGGCWLGWVALREHRGILAVLPIFAILGTNIINTKSPDPVALPETAAAAISLLVVAVAHLGAMHERWARQRLLALPATGSRFALS